MGQLTNNESQKEEVYEFLKVEASRRINHTIESGSPLDEVLRRIAEKVINESMNLEEAKKLLTTPLSKMDPSIRNKINYF